MSAVVHIAIFASGHGSNTEAIIQYFKKHDPSVKIALIVTNNPKAGVIDVASRHNVPVQIISNKTLEYPELIIEQLEKFGIDWIVLAGFLRQIPPAIVKRYQQRMLNIHPALLPKYGGKGMYGDRVHLAVLHNQEKESGITIHYVSEKYDEGQIIFQQKVTINKNETISSLREKIRQLEHYHYPRIIHQLIRNQNQHAHVMNID